MRLSAISVGSLRLLLAACLISTSGCGRRSEPAPSPAPPAPTPAAAHDHHHGPARTPQSYAQLVAFVREHADRISSQLQKSSVGSIPDDAHAIAMLAADAGKLALADSAVPRDKVREANLAGKDLAKAADSLHELADAGKLEEARASLADVSAIIERIAAAGGVPLGWTCPMRCEPGKVYEKAGICPVCRMALARVGTYAAMVTVVSPTIAPGKPVELRIELLTPAGEPVGKLAVVHEHPLHLMTVSNDLSWYSHDHPARQADGSFKVELTFPSPGAYTFFLDFTPEGEGQQVPTAPLEIAGSAPARVPLVEDIDSLKDIDGYHVRMRCNGGPFMAGRDEVVRYGIGIRESPVTDLEQIMGALGHLVIISEDLTTFVHSHPLNDEVNAAPASSGESASSHGHSGHAGHDHGGASPQALMAKAAAYGNGTSYDPVFHVVFPRPGLYKAFAQFQHKGKVITVPYTIDVKARDAGTSTEHEHEHAKPGGAS